MGLIYLFILSIKDDTTPLNAFNHFSYFLFCLAKFGLKTTVQFILFTLGKKQIIIGEFTILLFQFTSLRSRYLLFVAYSW